MKVLVTGATGFIGNYVIEQLLEQGYTVIATSTNIELAKQKSWFEKVIYVPYKIFQPKENLYEFFKCPDVLIHLAWEGLPNYKELFHIEKNLWDNYSFIKELVVGGLKNITVIGTCFEYGMVEGCLKEDMITNPANPYAIAKDSLRKFLNELKVKHNFNFKWVRLFYMYGEGQSPKSIIPQLQQALKNGDEQFNMSKGDQLRDYLSIEEVARNIYKIALQTNVEGIINCCSGKPIKLQDFIQDYLSKINKSIKLNLGYYPYSDVEPFAFWGDDTKLKSILNP